MSNVELSLYEIKNGKVKLLCDLFSYDLRQAFVCAMNSIVYFSTANHIKFFLNSEHTDYLCFDKNDNGVWSDSTHEFEPTNMRKVAYIEKNGFVKKICNICDEMPKMCESCEEDCARVSAESDTQWEE